MIEQTEDCYYYFKKPINFKSGPHGERIIGNGNIKKTIVAIGESQMMGIDWSDNKLSGPHDLNRLFPDKNLLIFAAPNNGPIQNEYRLRDIPVNILKNADAVIVGFNFSTDVFRISSNWDHKKSSPISFELFDVPFFKYFLFDTALLNARFQGKYFSNNVPNATVIFDEYKNIDKTELIKIYLKVMTRLLDRIKPYNQQIYLIIYPPYWGVDELGNLRPEIKDDLEMIICTSYRQLNAIKIISTSNKKYTLSEDGRHFPQGDFTFTNEHLCKD